MRRKALPEQANGVLKRRVLSLIVVLRAEVFDSSLRNIQLRLGQFDDRSQAQVLASLRQMQSQRKIPRRENVE